MHKFFIEFQRVVFECKICEMFPGNIQFFWQYKNICFQELGTYMTQNLMQIPNMQSDSNSDA